MAFLDNSGDIILDAVLTDTGRRRMAQGTFRVTQFALGDDEIDYSLYDTTQASAYYDLKILQTPILESFTNNMSSMKSKLITVTNPNLLYLPILKLYNFDNLVSQPNPTINMHLIAVDSTTETALSSYKGVIQGLNPQNNSRYIRVDQGTDSSQEPGAGLKLEAELTETSYIIEIDNRLGRILAWPSKAAVNPNYIDDDNVASYFIQSGDSGMINDIRLKQTGVTDTGVTVLNGKRGTKLEFTIQSTTDLASNYNLFNTLGHQFNFEGNNLKFIDTNVRITGVSTGYRIDIPIRFVRI